ncbi:TRAP transporter small permease subunit [Bacillus sp. Marseille-P3661]|uniref:TRAP transporter small permease subunit n=1 Tax=Bacillus sp. Marseille-P3661 TaxID=1936234 RepID=UPI000C81E611|nr:TRAP transporter small permease [Bacillus sp. Marseille-P3661]
MKKIVRAINAINNTMGIIAGVLLVLLSLVVFYDIISRYFFNSPTLYAFDLSTWLSGIAAFITGGYALLHNEHIRVDIFYERYPEKVKSIVEIISGILILMIAWTFFWYGGDRVLQLLAAGSVASTGLNIPLWIKWVILPIGGLLLGLQGLINLVKDIYHVCTGKRLWEEIK